MERFIKEYARHQKKEINNNELMNECMKEDAITKINKTLVLKERNLITVTEAIKNILESTASL